MSNFLSYIRYYLPITGFRFYLFIIMSLLSTLLEGIGLAVIVPVLELSVSTESEYSSFSNMFLSALNTIGVDPSLTNMLLLIVLIFIIRGMTLFSAKYITIAILVNFQEKVRLSLTHKIKNTDYYEINNISTAHLNNVLTREIEVLVKNLKCILSLCSSGITVVIFLLFAFIANLRVALLSIMFAFLLVRLFRGFIKNESQLSKELVKKNTHIQSYLLQILSYFKYLKATNKFRFLTSHLHDLIDDRKKIYLKMQAYIYFVQVSIEPLAIIMASLFIYYEVIVMNSNFTDIILPLMFLYRSLGRVGAIQSGWHAFISTSGSLHSVKDLQNNLDDNFEDISGADPAPLTTGITIKNVKYKYGNNVALDNISLNLQHKKTIGIVGETGSGKTTFVDLLCGLLKPDKGEIYWNDDHPYSGLNPLKLREHIGYVAQDSVLFDGTVLNNITLWTKDLKHEQSSTYLQKIIKQAKCDEFIDLLPRGLETIIGDGGITLSGGQRQRIALARELYRKPDLLIIDEGTSAVDAKTSSELWPAIKNYTEYGMVIMIAHQLSTIKNCDLIVVFNKAKITKIGTWSELVQDSDWFSQAVEIQNLI